MSLTWHQLKRAVNAVKGVEFVSRDKRYGTVRARLLSTFQHVSFDESELGALQLIANDETRFHLDKVRHLRRATPTAWHDRTVTALCGVSGRREVAHNWIGTEVTAADFCSTCRVLLDRELELGRVAVIMTVKWAEQMEREERKP